MSREEAIKYIRNVLRGREDKRGKTEIDIALETAIATLESVIALSEDLKTIDRESMDEKVLIGFNMALALFNKHLGGAE